MTSRLDLFGRALLLVKAPEKYSAIYVPDSLLILYWKKQKKLKKSKSLFPLHAAKKFSL